MTRAKASLFAEFVSSSPSRKALCEREQRRRVHDGLDDAPKHAESRAEAAAATETKPRKATATTEGEELGRPQLEYDRGRDEAANRVEKEARSAKRRSNGL